jgi:nucleoside-diphosphate-sugar epimerase
VANVVVTGGAGFIASHLCDRLLAAGHTVVCLDNLCTGARANVAHLEGRPDFTFVEADVSRPVDWPDRIDYLFHMASPASPIAYWRLPVETATVNAIGTHQALEASCLRGARFLLSSTSEVYGDPLIHPQAEGYWGNVNPVGPRACYDEGKRFAEALAVSYYRAHNLDVRIVRIFNTYGPRSDPDDGRMVPNFIRQALSGQPLTVHGDGAQTRSLCYVDDLVEGLMRAMFSPAGAGEVFNLGNPDEHTVKEYALIIRDLCGSSSEIQWLPARDEEPARRRPDITKAGDWFGWAPETPLPDGLERTVAWFRQRLGIPEAVPETTAAE